MPSVMLRCKKETEQIIICKCPVFDLNALWDAAMRHRRWRPQRSGTIVVGTGPAERPGSFGEARSQPIGLARDQVPSASVAAEIDAMHTRPRLRHPLARALARTARALERAYLAHGTRMAKTGGFGLP